MNQYTIKLTDSSATTRFAAEEFIRLMKKADPATRMLITDDGKLKIGLTENAPLPEVCDKKLDDAIAIDVDSMQGYITGSNERSVLFAVYRFFTDAGATFIRPGKDGEIIPRFNAEDVKVKLSEAAATRYRGICLEGSAGYEHVVDMIDFAPKLGMNIFFTQLWRPTFAFNRWYGNKKSPSYVPSDFSEDAQDAAVSEYEKEIFLRGLNHHKMGHGFIPSILGEKCGLWHGVSRDGLLKDEQRELVAMIGGERKLFNGSAVDTSFCYGNPKARGLIVDEVVKYAEEHPEVDTLHFWLADQPNNQCECELCRDTLPSDFYIDMCNEIDEALTARGTYRYCVGTGRNHAGSVRLNNAMVDSILSVNYSMNNVVVKTYPGMAQAVASAIDSLNMHSVLGCVAGDDTIILVTTDEASSVEISTKIRELMKSF